MTVTCLDTAEGGAARRGTATECLLPWESVFVLVRITSELDGVELYEEKMIKIGVGYNRLIELSSSLFDSELIVYYVNAKLLYSVQTDQTLCVRPKANI